MPDEEIFTETTVYDFQILKQRLRELSFLNKGVKISLKDLRPGQEREEVYLQEVRYPDNVVQSFANAQAARAEVETAKAQQEKAKIEAETNKIKTTALTNAVLKEKLIDAIKNGKGTYIIDTNNISIGVK